MKLLCYMLNMIVPGVGLFILKDWIKGALLSLFSVIAWGRIVPGLYQGYKLFETMTNMYDLADGDPAGLESGSNQLKEIIANNIPILALGVIGFIILKVTLIWSQAATVRAFKEKKESEDQSLANPEVPFIDSSN